MKLPGQIPDPLPRLAERGSVDVQSFRSSMSSGSSQAGSPTKKQQGGNEVRKFSLDFRVIMVCKPKGCEELDVGVGCWLAMSSQNCCKCALSGRTLVELPYLTPKALLFIVTVTSAF